MFKVKINVTINLYTTSRSIQIISCTVVKTIVEIYSMHTPTCIHNINNTTTKAKEADIII